MSSLEIVSCHYAEDLKWLESSPHPVHVIGKEGGRTGDLNASKFASVEVIPNFAMEASSYLRYIIKNYDNLPDRIAFIHGHENSPHQRIPIFDAIESYGHLPFVDLNRFLNTYMIILPNSTPYHMWRVLMSPHFGDVPWVINFRGMAQFVIKREVVLTRPLDFYQLLYKKSFWMYDSEWSGSRRNPDTSKWLGFFFEWVWHLIFGIESPIAETARPNVFLDDSNKELIFVGENSWEWNKGDYLDIFLDSDLLIYKTQWDFMRAIERCGRSQKTL